MSACPIMQSLNSHLDGIERQDALVLKAERIAQSYTADRVLAIIDEHLADEANPKLLTLLAELAVATTSAGAVVTAIRAELRRLVDAAAEQEAAQ